MDSILTIPGQFTEEVLPDLASVIIGEFGVVEGNMDTRDKSVVEGANAVGCQEENALTILRCAEKAYDILVSVVMVSGLMIDMKTVKKDKDT